MITIRKMEETDRADVKRMMKFFYSSPAVFTDGSEDIFEKDIKECLSDSPYLFGFIIESDGKMAGYAMVSKCFNTEFGRRCVWIEDLFIIPEYRRTGIASEFVDWLRAENSECVIRLEVEKENKPAVSAYSSKGFKDVPYTQKYILPIEE